MKPIMSLVTTACAVALMTGCESDSDSDSTTTSSSTSSDVVASTTSDTSTDLYTAWKVNSSNDVSAVMLEDGAGILVNVQSVSPVTVNSVNYAQVKATGIPDYSVEMTQTLIDDLNARPKASSDFLTGQVTVSAGETVAFGEDIGYNSNSSCTTGAGAGYWPPGPVCPENTNKTGYFPEAPEQTDDECDTGLSAIGYAINGTSIYNWDDGQSYNNENVWDTLAPVAETYDVDICGGHAANGDYHHHFYSSCWADMAGEDKVGHSPIYGYAADGYPVYGPWYDTGVPAKSSWVARDYSATSATGCGTDGERSCLLVDQYDISKGTETASSSGPTTSGSFTSQSGNSFSTTSGFFFQDYYYDSSLAEQGGAYLDQYNGHEHDGLGYHYHLTITQKTSDSAIPFELDDGYVPSFPYTFGPRYRGKLADNAISSCSGSGMGMGKDMDGDRPQGPPPTDGRLPPPRP